MASNAAKGSYYRGRTKKWLEGRGWAVAQMEEMRVVRAPGRPPAFVKRDQLGCDLLAVNRERIMFVQVKFADDESRLGLQKVWAEFVKWPCPAPAVQVCAVWRRGARAPVLHSAPFSGEGDQA